MIVSCFKFIFCYSYVCVFLVVVFLYDCGLVNNSFLKALAVEGARVFLSAVASQHTSSFRLPHKKSTTTLSEHVWNLKNNNIEHCISWEIIENSHPYNTASKKCFCTAEKYFIFTGKPTLNKRREISAQCPHRKKHLLQNIWESSTARQSLQRP